MLIVAFEAARSEEPLLTGDRVILLTAPRWLVDEPTRLGSRELSGGSRQCCIKEFLAVDCLVHR